MHRCNGQPLGALLAWLESDSPDHTEAKQDMRKEAAHPLQVAARNRCGRNLELLPEAERNLAQCILRAERGENAWVDRAGEPFSSP